MGLESAPAPDARRTRWSPSRSSAYYGNAKAIADVTLGFSRKNVTALIGPSGCGKSTLLRCLNRIHEYVPGASVEGQVLLDGQNVYDPEVEPVSVRRRIGMVFQRANPFPTMSILDDVTSGLRTPEGRTVREQYEVAERALRVAALWDEVKDKLQNRARAFQAGSSNVSASRARLRSIPKCS